MEVRWQEFLPVCAALHIIRGYDFKVADFKSCHALGFRGWQTIARKNESHKLAAHHFASQAEGIHIIGYSCPPADAQALE